MGWALVCAAASLAGACSSMRAAHSTGEATRPSFRILQFNLCNSGIAACYTGRSVREAADVIRTRRPDAVALNEICRSDLTELEQVMSRIQHDSIAAAFEPADDRRTNRAFQCRNGQRYGIGLLARLASKQGYRIYRGGYPVQDVDDPEERVWLCLHSVSFLYACTTHLASASAPIALTQCRYLLQTGIPTMLRQHGLDPVVLGADLNLTTGGSPDARACLTHGYHWASDGAMQFVVATRQFAVHHTESINMHETTDHPGLLVDLTST